ncbi:MAG: helix-hairpin-helix domain-containing protein [Saprospiraceae bacterium]|nr:helix-hairpin-helix domain-containing protein [Saprospiraceae bacterium]
MKNNPNFYFTRRERKSIVVFAFVAFFLTTMLYAIYRFDDAEIKPLPAILKDEVALNSITESRKIKKRYRSLNPNTTKVFKFNPNQVNEDSLAMLGIDRKAISNLMKYLNKGGKIKDMQHFFKIYGMEKYRNRLDTLLEFDQKQRSNSVTENKEKSSQNIKNTVTALLTAPDVPVVRIKIIEINGTDSFELQMMKGIGAFMASRIIKFRDKLGGYYEVAQLEEIYGMRPETFMAISHLIEIDTSLIRKMDINAANEAEMAKHPYIGKKRAGILAKYRNHHGIFSDMVDLQKTRLFDEDELSKLKHYLFFQ